MIGTKRELLAVAPDGHRTSPRKQRSYAMPQLRRQSYYNGPAAELDEEECRALLADLIYMFGADHDFYAPLPPYGLPGIRQGKFDPYGIEWRIISIGLSYLGAAARNEGRAMHNRWNAARELAREIAQEAEAEYWAREMRRGDKRLKAAQKVYFIAGQSGPIKIGIAVDPRNRLSGLQTSHHERLSILATCDGGAVQERLYHRQFADSRLNGEWFERTPELMAEIERLNEMAKAA